MTWTTHALFALGHHCAVLKGVYTQHVGSQVTVYPTEPLLPWLTAVLCCGVLWCAGLQGIEGFAADQRKLEEQLAKLAADMKH
jgi:hypothetical protein